MAGYLTTAELAERFHITPKTALRWRREGNGPGHVRAGKKILYPVGEVERYERELAAAAGLPLDAMHELEMFAERLGLPLNSPGMQRLAEVIRGELAGADDEYGGNGQVTTDKTPERWQNIGGVGIGPGGRLLLADPDYAKKDGGLEDFLEEHPDESGVASCREMAMQISTGGDGDYQVSVLRGADGIITAVRVDFGV